MTAPRNLLQHPLRDEPDPGEGGLQKEVPHLIVVGDLVTDVVAVLAAPLCEDSDTPARIQVTGGGQAANTAAWLAWAAARHHAGQVTLVAAAGDDQAGDERVAELQASGVTCRVARRTGTPTGAIVVLAHGGQRTMVTDRGANLTLTVADIDAALDATLGNERGAGHLHLSGYTLLDAACRDAGQQALVAARERGLTTSVDASSAAPLRQVGPAAFVEWVRGTDLLLANRDEAAVLASHIGLPNVDALAATARQEPQACANATASVGGVVGTAIVIKYGADGAVWIGADGTIAATTGVPVDAVDPTGAGDAFAAGLLTSWVSGGTPAEALRAGAQLGASAVRRVGARPTGGRSTSPAYPTG